MDAHQPSAQSVRGADSQTQQDASNPVHPNPQSSRASNISTSSHKDASGSRSSIATGTPTLSKTETVFCGALAGVIARFVIAPLDVVKIRMQMQTQRKDLSTILNWKANREIPGSASKEAIPTKIQPKYRGMFSSMATIVREEGVRGLWKGNMAAEYLYLTYSGIQFLVYQQTKVLLAKTAEASSRSAASVRENVNTISTNQGGTTVMDAAVPLRAVSNVIGSSVVQSFIAGANAGMIATACTYPFDLLRTRFAIQRDVKVYTGLAQACKHIYRQDGIPGFYRGMSPALIQVIPYMGIMFGSYDTLKQIASWLKQKADAEPSQTQTTRSSSLGQFLLGLEDFLCGAMSGVISKTGVYPLDMVRKRLQVQGSEQQKTTINIYSPEQQAALSKGMGTPKKLPNSVWRCIIYIARNEGYLALFKGLLPGLIKAAPSSAVIFLVFNQAGTLVEKFRRS